jgi:glucose uptake protein GlcU
MKRFQLVWLGFCVLAIIVVGLVLEGNEEQCRAQSGYLCLRSGAAFLVVAAVGGVVWAGVALAVWIANAVSKWRRRGGS